MLLLFEYESFYEESFCRIILFLKHDADKFGEGNNTYELGRFFEVC